MYLVRQAISQEDVHLANDIIRKSYEIAYQADYDQAKKAVNFPKHKMAILLVYQHDMPIGTASIIYPNTNFPCGHFLGFDVSELCPLASVELGRYAKNPERFGQQSDLTFTALTIGVHDFLKRNQIKHWLLITKPAIIKSFQAAGYDFNTYNIDHRVDVTHMNRHLEGTMRTEPYPRLLEGRIQDFSTLEQQYETFLQNGTIKLIIPAKDYFWEN